MKANRKLIFFFWLHSQSHRDFFFFTYRIRLVTLHHLQIINNNYSTMQSYTSIVKAANFILSRPTLAKVVTPLANKFVSFAGYREMGLKFNDILLEETPIMQTAIRRLPADLSYSRNYRILTAHQLALSHQLLPAEKAVKPEEDDHYLIPYILEAEKEAFEKAELDNIEVKA